MNVPQQCDVKKVMKPQCPALAKEKLTLNQCGVAFVPTSQTVRCDAGVRTHSMQAAHDKKEAAVIRRDDSTALEVTNANAKLAAEALLRGLSKRVDNSVMQELEVVAVSADVDTSKLSLLRKGWYQHATYFFE